MLSSKIKDLIPIIELLESMENKEDEAMLLKSIGGNLEELKVLREEVKELRVCLEMYKFEYEALSLAVENKIKEEIGYEY